MPPAPEMIGGYKVVRELGRGAMGTVYLAYQDNLGRELAIKLMAPEFVRDEEFVERFRREGRIAAKLRHPNIVQVYDFCDREGLYFIAMEYLGSRTLKNYVQDHGRVPVDDAVRLVDQLLAALDHAHRQGIVHRDIKPANVMVTDGNDAALTDFSIAQMKSASKLTQTGSVLGTPEYMAPEQFEGKTDSRSDLYACGVILYEMLTGFSPFHADTIAEIMKKQLFTAPDPPTAVDFTIPEPISQMVVKSLAKNPDDRYQTAAEMRAAMRSALTASGSESSLAAPIPSELKPLRVKESAEKKAPPPVIEARRISDAPAREPARPKSAETAKAPPRKLDLRANGEPPSVVIRPGPPTTPDTSVDSKRAVSLAPPAPPPVPEPKPEPPTAVEKPSVPVLPPPPEEPSSGSGGIFGFIEDEGTTILALAGIGSLGLMLPASHWSGEMVGTLATGGVVGLVCLLPFCLLLSLFMFLRKASLVRALAPIGVALGLLIGLAVTYNFWFK
ncbi:MAG: serine/threonine-protein kinase [Vulcanimicrobiota bacterium]